MMFIWRVSVKNLAVSGKKTISNVCQEYLFSFCEVNDEVTKEGENIDSGFASNPNSRTGSVLCEKVTIPQPVFPMIHETEVTSDK